MEATTWASALRGSGGGVVVAGATLDGCVEGTGTEGAGPSEPAADFATVGAAIDDGAEFAAGMLLEGGKDEAGRRSEDWEPEQAVTAAATSAAVPAAVTALAALLPLLAGRHHVLLRATRASLRKAAPDLGDATLAHGATAAVVTPGP